MKSSFANDSYDAIAKEYYNPIAHPTCYNFLRLSRRLVVDALAQCHAGERVLEVGAGSSSAAPALLAYGLDLDSLEITDASESMLAHSRHWEAFGASLACADATNLGSPLGPVDWLVSSLADPYNTPSFWGSVARILAPGGRAVITLPAYEWAVRFRDERSPSPFHSAEFLLRDGSLVRVPSYLYPYAEQCRLIEDSGLAIQKFTSLGLRELSNEPLSRKLEVFPANFSSIIWGFVLIKP